MPGPPVIVSSIAGNPGGGGPGKGGGGISGPTPTLPTQGQNYFNELSTDLGASSSGGEYGTSIVYEEVPGDLGERYTNLNRFLLVAESNRENASFNGLSPYNHRYRGHREAFKFNLMMQKLVTISAQLFLILRSANTTLETRELSDMYPTDTEIANLYHVSEQIEFKEWMLLKSDDKRWFL